MTKIPKPLSPGECALELHLRVNKIAFEREVRLIEGRKWRYDFVLPTFRIVIEVHGGIWSRGKHARGAGLSRDYAKLNAAVMAGYRPLAFSTEMVESGEAIQTIIELTSSPKFGGPHTRTLLPPSCRHTSTDQT